MEPILNELAWELFEEAMTAVEELRIEQNFDLTSGPVLDFGIDVTGSLGAGLALSEISTAGMIDVDVVPGRLGEIEWPAVTVKTDSPFEACLLSQYAGWQLQAESFFAMGSGPMRAAYGAEEIFSNAGYREGANRVVGVLESSQMPTQAVVDLIAEKCDVEPTQVALAVAPTSSIAGSLQVVSRSLETALHKLYELGFDLGTIVSGFGTAPLAPVAKNDLEGIGRTNDAILYGGHVSVWVKGDDRQIEEIGPKVPASASPDYGKRFLDLFESAGRDFYALDPLLFSPAVVTFQNITTGRVHRFGRTDVSLVRESFGL